MKLPICFASSFVIAITNPAPVLSFLMAFAAFAVFREFQPFGSKMGQETAVQRSVGPDGAEPETEGQGQETNVFQLSR